MPEVEGVTHRDVIAGGLRMHLAEAGPEDAPPLLLVHGWPQHWYCWSRAVPGLSADHRLLMPDLRGFGWTEKPSSGYEKQQLADDLIALLDELGLDRVGYVGHDWGGFIGFLLGIGHPERFSSMLLLSIPHPWPTAEERRRPKRFSALSYQAPITAPFVAKRLMAQGLTKRVHGAASPRGTFSAADLEIYDAVMRTKQGQATTVAMYRTFLRRELLPLVRGRFADARLEPRTHLAVGADDLIMRGAGLGGYEQNAPNMTTEWVEGARHFLPEERPDLVVDRVRELAGTRNDEGPRYGGPSVDS